MDALLLSSTAAVADPLYDSAGARRPGGRGGVRWQRMVTAEAASFSGTQFGGRSDPPRFTLWLVQTLLADATEGGGWKNASCFFAVFSWDLTHCSCWYSFYTAQENIVLSFLWLGHVFLLRDSLFTKFSQTSQQFGMFFNRKKCILLWHQITSPGYLIYVRCYTMQYIVSWYTALKLFLWTRRSMS